MRIVIEHNPATRAVLVWFIREEPQQEYVAKPLILEYNLLKEGELCPPTLEISYREATQFFQSLAEALDKEGIKTTNDHHMAGILEAQSGHLEDMRKLVFKKLSAR